MLSPERKRRVYWSAMVTAIWGSILLALGHFNPGYGPMGLAFRITQIGWTAIWIVVYTKILDGGE